MTTTHLKILFVLTICLSCCVNSGDKTNNRTAYNNTVKIDTIDGNNIISYRQSKNYYRLNYFGEWIKIFNVDPKQNLTAIDYFFKYSHTDTSSLSSISRLDSKWQLEIRKLCSDANDKEHFGKFIDWRLVCFVIKNGNFIKVRDEITTDWILL